MRELKQSTAVDVMIGPFLDETNGKDAETTLTVTQAEVRLSKNGGNMAQKAEATSLVHDELGHYVCKLDGTDTNTLGQLRVMVHESGALPVWEDFAILPANVWDSKYSTDKLQVHVVEFTADIITSAAIADDAISAEHLNTGVLTADAFAADAIVAATLATGVLTADAFAADAIVAATLATGVLTADAFAADAIVAATFATDSISADAIKADAVTEIQSGLASSAALTTHDNALAVVEGALATVDTNVDSILADTGSTGVAIAADAIAEIRSGLARATALTIHDNALAAAEETINTINGNVNSILTDTGSAGVVISAANKADIADRVWDETMADHVGAGSTGAKLNGAGGAAGSGAVTFTYTVYEDDESTPLAGVDVWVCTDEAGSNVVAGTVVTDVSGEAIFYLDAATYYFFRQKPGWNFTNPDTEVVSE